LPFYGIESIDSKRLFKYPNPMKAKFTSRLHLLLAGSALLAVSGTHAATLYWDGTSSTANADGGNGTWNNLSTANWDTLTIGGADSQWNNSGLDTAVFGGAAGTATLGENISVGGLRFDTTGYTIDAGAGTLSFGAPNNIIGFSRVSSATITGAVAGSGNVATRIVNPMVGTTLTNFTLAFTGTSTGGWSGTTTVGNLSTLALSQSNQALLNTSGITLNGSAIALTNTSAGEALLDRVSDSAAITSNGGTITFANTAASGNVYAESIGNLTHNSGQLNLFLNTNQNGGGGNKQTLTLGNSGVGLAQSGSSNIILASGGGLNTTTNIIRVNGITTSTAANQILGPWATVGTSAGTATDFAKYTSDGTYGSVVAANIAASAETTWTDSASAYSVASGTTTLTGIRTMMGLRFTGSTSVNIGLGDFNLETNAIINTTAGGSTVSSAGTGSLTTPSGGGNLYLATNSNNLTISAPIVDNGGAVTVVKFGSTAATISGVLSNTGGLAVNGGTLTVNNASNSFTGGVSLSGGSTLTVSANTHLGNASNTITLNSNATLNFGTVTYARDLILNNEAIATFNGNTTISGNMTGTGGLAMNNGFGTQATFSGTANTFEGPILIGSSGTTGQAYRYQFSSLADSSTANGEIAFTASSVTHGDGSVFQWNGSSGFVLANRQIRIASTGTTPSNGHQIRNNGTGTLTIGKDLDVSSPYAQTVALKGTNTGDNTFAGKISDNPNAAAGTTALAATYALGATTATLASVQGVTVGASISGAGIAGGTLITAVNTSTRVVTLDTATTGAGALNQVMTVTGVTNSVSILKADAGTWTLSGNNSHGGGTTLSGGRLNINSATALGTGTFTFGSAATTIGNTSGNAITLSTNNAMSWNQDFTFATGSNDLNLGTGAVNMGGNRAITTGASTKLTVGGMIGSTGAFGITKGGGGTLVLTNTSSTYAGATSINQGVLEISSIADYSANSSIGAPASGDITIGGATTNGTLLYAGTTASSNRTIRVGQNTAGSTGNGTINNNGTGALTFTATTFNSASSATANRNLTLGGTYTGSANEIQGVIVNNTGGGLVNVVKADAGTWKLSASNAYTGTTTINAGRLAITGATQSTTGITFTGGSLGLDIANTVAAASATVDFTNGNLTVTGTPTLASYTLLTANSITGLTPSTLSPSVPGYELQLAAGDTELRLVQTGAPSGYAAWQAANSTAGTRDQDHDNDGVDNGTEHFLGGTTNTTGFTALPTVVDTAGTLSVTWTKAASYTGAYNTDYVVETSATLAGPWTTETVGGNVAETGADVKYTFPGGPAYTGKNFARLKVTGP
jgi:autotransporter-associated beta strand protein